MEGGTSRGLREVEFQSALKGNGIVQTILFMVTTFGLIDLERGGSFQSDPVSGSRGDDLRRASCFVTGVTERKREKDREGKKGTRREREETKKVGDKETEK